jgi:hypothetical protein
LQPPPRAIAATRSVRRRKTSARYGSVVQQPVQQWERKRAADGGKWRVQTYGERCYRGHLVRLRKRPVGSSSLPVGSEKSRECSLLTARVTATARKAGSVPKNFGRANRSTNEERQARANASLSEEPHDASDERTNEEHDAAKQGQGPSDHRERVVGLRASRPLESVAAGEGDTDHEYHEQDHASG